MSAWSTTRENYKRVAPKCWERLWTPLGRQHPCLCEVALGIEKIILYISDGDNDGKRPKSRQDASHDR